MGEENLNNVVELVMLGVDRLPDPPREHIKKEVQKFKTMIMDNRPPRILILGRRGAGKSSLVNAIFMQRVADVGSVVAETGKAQWHTWKNSKGSINILDTRGTGDNTQPESANFTEAIDENRYRARVWLETGPAR